MTDTAADDAACVAQWLDAYERYADGRSDTAPPIAFPAQELRALLTEHKELLRAEPALRDLMLAAEKLALDWPNPGTPEHRQAVRRAINAAELRITR